MTGAVFTTRRKVSPPAEPLHTIDPKYQIYNRNSYEQHHLGESLGESLSKSLREFLGQSLPQALLTYTLAARTGHSDVPGKTTHHSGENTHPSTLVSR